MATHHEVSEHKHGDMNIVQHQKTFDGFVKFMTWTAIAVIVILVFMALVNG